MKVIHEKLLSNFGFNCNLRHYNEGTIINTGKSGDLYFGVLGTLCTTCLPYKGFMDEVRVYDAEVEVENILYFKAGGFAKVHFSVLSPV